jgi:3-isopropylmalate/(R)-2-methylmalate dehydratase large subunit
MAGPQTLFDKIWSRHVVLEKDGETLLYIDRHLIHDGSGRAFEVLRDRGLTVRRPDRVFATPDHYVPTTSRDVRAIDEPERRVMVESLISNTDATGITHFGITDQRQGIVHVIGPEQGITQPGLTLVCGDSHTATHGALGALSFGIGSSEVSHVLATQTLWQRKPKRMRISVEGALGQGVTAKDVVLAIIAKIGAAGATGHAVEYAGSSISGLSMEGRLTLCNMSIEAGARSGMVAPDATTEAYLDGRPYAPKGAQWEKAVAYWRSLPTDPGASFDREVTLDGAAIQPMATWGTSPEDAAPITGSVPDPASASDAERRATMTRALDYMGLTPGTKLTDITFDRVFIGSCTNSRIEDLRAAAKVLAGRRASVPGMVSPGSSGVKRQAEAEGLDKIFLAAGLEWRDPGCSMCNGSNGELVAPGERCASTTNRNFEGRQGRGALTHIMSPSMVAAAAVRGRITDVRRLTERARG